MTLMRNGNWVQIIIGDISLGLLQMNGYIFGKIWLWSLLLPWPLDSMTMQRQPDPCNGHDPRDQDNASAKQAKHVVMS